MMTQAAPILRYGDGNNKRNNKREVSLLFALALAQDVLVVAKRERDRKE